MNTPRPPLNFDEMGIPHGSELQCVRKPATVTVVDGRRVSLDGETVHLHPATQRVLGVTWNLHPTKYWKFNGVLLSKIYDDTYGHRGG